MAENVLDSYLVKLGATTDVGAFNKLQSVLGQTERSVTGMLGSSIAGFVKLETTIVGTFAAVGTGIIALADKTAMADQQYRLFGLRMLMGKDQARAMQMALDNLGATIDEVAYDPELNARFRDLYERNIALGKSLGPLFDNDMKGIRGLRTEFKQFGTELEFLSMGSVGKFYEKLGLGSGDLLRDVRDLNEQFSDNLPAWADKASSFLIPIWKDFNVVMKDTGSLFMTAAGDFTYLVGVLSNDKSIQSTKFDVDNFGKAIVHSIDGVTQLSLVLELLARIGMHAFMTIANTAMAAYETMVGMATVDDKRIATGKALMNSAADQSVSIAADLRDMLGNEANWSKNPDFAGMVGYNTAHGYNPVTRQTTAPTSASAAPTFSSATLSGLVAEASAKTGLDPALIAAVIKQESHGDPNILGPVTRSGEQARGLMQLMSATAQQYGVSDAFDPHQNVMGGSSYLASLLKRYNGDEHMALAAYNEGPAKLDRQGMGRLPNETRDYIDKVMGYQAQGEASKGDIIINGFQITIPPNTDPERFKHLITQSLTDVIKNRDKRVMAQTAAGAYAPTGAIPPSGAASPAT